MSTANWMKYQSLFLQVYRNNMRNSETTTISMEFTAILLGLLFAWFCLHISGFLTSKLKLPPGPFPIPIFGSLFKLGKKPHESLAKLAKTYGPLMTIKLGSMTTVVVSSPSIAKEIYQTHDQAFTARPIPDAIRVLNQHKVSLIWSPNSPHWRNLRKICASHMFTTQRLNNSQEIRVRKVKDLIDHVREKAKLRQAINVGQVIFCTTLNMISNTLFSIDMDNLSSGSQEFKTLVWQVTELVGTPNVADYFPWLRLFDPQRIKRRTTIYFQKFDKIFNAIIDERLQLKEQGAFNDFINALLFSTQEENASKLSRLEMLSLLKELLLAGTDTSAGTLEWAMAELLLNRDILTKARLELKENIKEDRPILESDIARLPYLQAVVKETLRLHPIAPLLVPRKAQADTEICGFTVPRNAQVLVNMWAIGRDPDLWANPTSFLPDRFLGSNVDYRGRDFEFIPFGGGRKICPGLPLAHRVIHLMLASLLYSFDWELEHGMEPNDIDMEDKFGLTLHKATPLYALPVLPY